MSDNNLFVSSSPGGQVAGTVGEYNASTGAAINAYFIRGLSDTDGLEPLMFSLQITIIFWNFCQAFSRISFTLFASSSESTAA